LFQVSEIYILCTTNNAFPKRVSLILVKRSKYLFYILKLTNMQNHACAYALSYITCMTLTLTIVTVYVTIDHINKLKFKSTVNYG
jgi:hypothetical protein